MSLPRLYTARQVAKELGVSAYWLCEKARKGEIDAQKLAGAWRWSSSQVDALIEQSATPKAQLTVPAIRRPRQVSQSSADVAPVVQLIAKQPRRRRAS